MVHHEIHVFILSLFKLCKTTWQRSCSIPRTEKQILGRNSIPSSCHPTWPLPHDNTSLCTWPSIYTEKDVFTVLQITLWPRCTKASRTKTEIIHGHSIGSMWYPCISLGLSAPLRITHARYQPRNKHIISADRHVPQARSERVGRDANWR